MDKFSKIEVAGALLMAGFVLYTLWKAKQGLSSIGSGIAEVVGDARDSVVRGFNTVGSTVSNTADSARLSVSDALFNVFGPEVADPTLVTGSGAGTAAQNMTDFHTASGISPTGSYYDDWSYAPDDFQAASQRQAKPLTDLGQPPTDYVIPGTSNNTDLGIVSMP